MFLTCLLPLFYHSQEESGSVFTVSSDQVAVHSSCVPLNLFLLRPNRPRCLILSLYIMFFILLAILVALPGPAPVCQYPPSTDKPHKRAKYSRCGLITLGQRGRTVLQSLFRQMSHFRSSNIWKLHRSVGFLSREA